MNKRAQAILRKALIATVACTSAAALAAPAAQAGFGIEEFGTSTSINGALSRQAGAHPDFRTRFEFDTSAPVGNPRDIRVRLPDGLVGNPNNVPACPLDKLISLAGDSTQSECSGDTQVGFAEVRAGLSSAVPVFNMEHPAGAPGLFAFDFLSVPVFIEPEVRPSDYGITALSANTSQAKALQFVDLTLWGIPADSSHDAQRWNLDPFGCGCTPGLLGGHSLAPRLPFMTNPTSCLPDRDIFTLDTNTWQEPGASFNRSVDSDLEGTPFKFTGCERLPFEPSIIAQPGTHRAHSTSGLDITIKVPQNSGPDGLATAHVRRVVTTFPKGVTVSTSAVAGLEACSPSQIALGTNIPPTCPNGSKIGNVTVKTELLEKPLEGEVLLASQNNNPSHSTFAVYMVAKGPGFYLKLPAELNVDKQTGQLSTIFDNLPQQPFTEAHIDFRGGPTGPITTPDKCGTYTTRTVFTSWASSEPVVYDNPMVINENCEGGGEFKPTLQAGVANPVAGANSPLTFRVRRQDGEQNLSRIEATLPEGELAKLKGVEVCPDNLAITGACGKASQVGIATNAIGTGVFPLFVPQPGKDPTALYLAGPYKGAPYSLITKVPAQSGPFDFGTIVVRSGINVNPITTQAIVKSDPLPQILEGVPIAYRDVRIEVQKPDFTVNPTSCEQRFVTTDLSSTEGAHAHPSVPFKVGDCASLDFAPKLSFKVKGGTHRGDFQALTAVLKTHKHEANIARVAVTLPHSEFLEQSHIGTVCTRVQFAADKCPAASVYGAAQATTPLLDKPLEGPVYLRSSSNTLPDLVARLNGQFDVELGGRIDSVNGGIRNTFEVVPDAPVSSFVLKMKGGDKSLLVNSRNLCKEPSRAEVKMTGQNGMRHNERPVVTNGCGKGSAKKHAKPKRHH